jgi:cation diffusion facilitator CzcD-associated flavoprotein CzcO
MIQVAAKLAAGASMINATFIGGGPAGLAPLVWAARQGALRRLAAEGLVVIERGQKIGAGTIGRYAIGSDTLAETFLECLEDSAELSLGALREHPATLAVAAYRGGSVPLPLAANFLETLGEAMSGAILSAGGRILTNCEAVRSRRRADGDWQTTLRTTTGEHHIVSRNLVLATGAEQSCDPLYARPVAGEALLPRFADKLMLSGEVLAAGGAAEVAKRLGGIAAPQVAIVGGSHSALAVTNVLLNRCRQVDFAPGAITLMHRRPLRIFYPSADAAVADGYTDFEANDICPVSHRLFRLAGFRLEARELVMRALGIGCRPPEPRLRLHHLHGSTAQVVARRVLEHADLVIAALGYRPNALPIFDMNGRAMLLAEAPSPLVDRDCRVLDINGLPIPRLLGIGLAAGFIPSGALGGEPSFRGQTNGIWLWQNGVGAMIFAALLDGKIDHVAASAAAQ